MRRFWYDTEFIEYPETIDLISIGIVGENGEEYYAISHEFDPDKASQWVKDNVIERLPSSPWLSRAQIKADLIDFLKPSEADPVELWGYYPAYDHVALCWLFGAMIDLPKGMPWITMDVKQWALQLGNPKLPPQDEAGEHDALQDARWTKRAWEFLRDYDRRQYCSRLMSAYANGRAVREIRNQ